MPSGECFIVSADRYSVYDPVARKGNPPTDPDDEAGRIGRGPLHIEAEWDIELVGPLQKAIDEIDKRLSDHPRRPTNAATYKADKETMEGMRATFRKDVQRHRRRGEEAAAEARAWQEDPAKKSKEERAPNSPTSKDRPVFWM